jgi:hypothetical protein
MITFEPDSPWEVGQVVVFREEGRPNCRKVVVSVEHSDDGSETQYQLVNPTLNAG